MENPETVFYIVAAALFTVLCCCPTKERGEITTTRWNPPLCLICCSCMFGRCREKSIIAEPLEEIDTV
jgi:hypothetical protein